MRRSLLFLTLFVFALVVLYLPSSVYAQEGQQPDNSPGLLFFTPYPSQVIGIGETVDLELKLANTGSEPQVARLEIQQLPEGWTASFRGDNRIIEAVYVLSNGEASVDLRIEPPAGTEPGTYNLTAIARGSGVRVELPIELTVKGKLPPSLTFDVELPTLRGTSTTSFRYNATLKNEGDEDLSVNLSAEAPIFFQVTFELSGQEVTSIPVEANESKRLTIEAKALGEIPAGSYPIVVRALGGGVEAALQLAADISGQPELSITAPDGRLSAQAQIGQENPLKVIIQNRGTAPARGIKLSSSEPSGWSVTFEPEEIQEISPGQQVEVTAKVLPAENAVAGDYVITVRAQPAEGTSKSADFRITVLTSTLWGAAGIGLIAVAVGVVAVAVMRFGRR